MPNALIILNESTIEFDKKYCYEIPNKLTSKVIPGVRVIIPFGNSNRSVQGFVLEVGDFETNYNLKSIKKVIDNNPIIPPDLIQILEWMKYRYICTYSAVLKCMLPFGAEIKLSTIIELLSYNNNNLNTSNPSKGLSLDSIQKNSTSNIVLEEKYKHILSSISQSEGEITLEDLKNIVPSRNLLKDLNFLEKEGFIAIKNQTAPRIKEKQIKVAYISSPIDEILSDIESDAIKKIQHIRILEMLMESDFIPVSDLINFSGVSLSTLNTLSKQGYIAFKQIEVVRSPIKDKPILKTYHLDPTPYQLKAINDVKSHMDTSTFSEFFLYGVTGSGKTEVYLQLIQYCIDNGKQAIVLVPEISLTPQMVERFQSRFGNNIAVLHSRLSLGERYDQWRLVKNQSVSVAIGARSAVFAPFEKLGIIIVDEEHELTYKSEVTPKYHAIDVARQRCILNNAILLRGSATPSEESFYSIQNKSVNLLPLPNRTNTSQLPQMEIVDMRNELSIGNRSIFSNLLLSEIEKNIKKNEQTIIFMNKRGFASFVLCRSCGYVVKCESCDVPMTYHLKNKRLICHYCGYTVTNPSKCPTCGSKYIKDFGSGTQKIEQELKKLFPNSNILRMDLDTTSGKNSHEQILTNFRDNNIDILVGTQMIAKGHHFPKVTLIGIISADISLNMCDYRASERTFQLITQVAGRAGREQLEGRVVIQTYSPENFSILSACTHDYMSFFTQDIAIRQKLFLPPFCNIGVILMISPDDILASKLIKSIGVFIKRKYSDMCVLGPSRPTIIKIKNRYRWRIILKHVDLNALITVLTEVSNKFYGLKEKKFASISIDINPINMM